MLHAVKDMKRRKIACIRCELIDFYGTDDNFNPFNYFPRTNLSLLPKTVQAA